MLKTIFVTIFLGLIAFVGFSHSGGGHKGFKFEENKGQLPNQVKFHSKLHIGDLFLENNRFTFDLFNAEELDQFYWMKHGNKKAAEIPNRDFHKHAYYMDFLGANTNPKIIGAGNLGTSKNYIRGNSTALDVQSFSGIKYQGLYDGIDVHMYDALNNLKYDFIVAPFANPNQIKIQYNGVTSVKLENGNLIVELSNGTIKELNPVSYQLIDGKRQYITSVFNLENNVLTFELDSYDKSKELIIDPTWVFSTLTGSSQDNWGYTATYDDQGNLLAGGIAFGTGYPTIAGSYQTSFGGGDFDIALSKFSSDGSTLLYSTYIGGSSNEFPHSMVVDNAGNLIVLATTSSSNFPLGASPYDATFNGGGATTIVGQSYPNGSDIAVFKLNATGTTLLAGTYVGGTGNDGINSNMVYNYGDEIRGEVVVNNANEIIISSSTLSSNFPTTSGSYSQTSFGSQDGICMKLSSGLDALTWSTYVGGGDNDGLYSVRVAANGDVYACGGTQSNDLATTAGVIGASYFGGSYDGTLVRLNGTNGALQNLSYIGTNSYDQSFILDLDNNGNVYVVGQSRGAYPVQNAAYSNAGADQFIHKLNSDFSVTDYSTVFGSGAASSGVDISISAFLVDNCENVYVSGWGGSTNNEGSTNGLPVTLDAEQSTTDGSDFYFFVLERNASNILYGSFLGNSNSAEHVDGGTSRFDKEGNVYQAVCAACGGGNFPTTPGAYSQTNGSSNCNLGAIKFEFDYQGVQAQTTDPGDITICAAPYDVVFPASSDPAITEEWYFGDSTLGVPNGTGVLPGGSEPMHTYADTGTYTVTYIAIDPATCNIRDTAYFDITLIKPAVFDAQIDIPAFDPCAGAVGLTIDLEFTGTGADSLSWDMGNGDVYSDSLDWAYTYTSTGTFTIEMIAYDLVCDHSDTIRQVVDYNPNVTTAQATPLGDITLCGQPYDINFPASPDPAVHEEWVFGDTIGGVVQTTGITLAGASPTHTYADTGSFEVTYYAIDSSTCNIIDSTKFTVTLIQPEELSAQITVPSFDPCTDTNGLDIHLEFTGTGADSIIWDMGNGDIVYNDLDWDYVYQNQGNFVLTMTAFDTVCNVTEVVTQNIDYIFSFSSAQANPPGNILLCDPPYDVPFVLSGSNPQYSNWDYGDGTTSGIGSTHSHTYTYADTGTYVVTYYAIDSNSCNMVDSATFTVALSQSETFNATLDFVPPPVCGSDTAFVNMEFTGSGADILIWDMGDGTTFNTNQVNYFYTDPDTYTITMYAEDTQCNKSQTISKTVNFVGNVNSEVIVPNVFTPNGDGQNDEIIFSGVDENAEFSWMIFNRWGTKIFETTSQNDPWKGGKGVDGKDLKPGVYYYELIYRDACKEEDNIKTGHITLMR